MSRGCHCRVLPALFVAIASLSLPAAFAQSGSEMQRLGWVHGPQEAKIGGQAKIDLPSDFAFLDANGTKRFLELTENIPSGEELGLLAPTDLSWFTIFSFDEIGYVKDDEKNSLDADAILKSIQEGTEAANEQRKSRGWGTMSVLGWIQPPHYDGVTHNLEWSFRGEDNKGVSIANYSTKYLGRRGVMRVEVVADPQNLTAVLTQFRKIMERFSYSPQNDYRAFVKGDKVAEYGLTALVIGGAAAAAAKTGLLKGLWKLVIIGWKLVLAGLVAFGAFLKRLFSTKKQETTQTS